ncbi:YbaB/EbfC family nucleoid-associated protein [Nonomuraea diastatica]|uniref:YbaB/EbfC family DNA-binding protein n=1 Tax=Nonomuraea diastatica TaxID=1848329 RepID=A0A4R4X3E7_9ACTN|nr:YbaB/EbfC family nucleoid-associated protein [Nonomuraea diastatica]TDD24774.1 YbaB/EbfC family DNA-binding protein [Nonomuraea diastatica]
MTHEFKFEDLDNATYAVERAARRAEDAKAELDAIVGEGESVGGHVRVTTDVSGRVLSIRLNPRVMKRGSGDLADELMVAIRRAQDDSDAQRERLMSGVLDAADPSLDAFAGRSRRGFDGIVDAHSRAMEESEARLNEVIRRIEDDLA